MKQSRPVAVLQEHAPAKVNLTLEIRGKRPDGYHELESLVLFADFGDSIGLRPASAFSLTVEGPFADKLSHGTNLIERTVSAYGQRFDVEAGGAFHLIKRLPVAAGLGGGSSDAGATLRLLWQAYGVPENLAELVPLARDLGADVPCCLYARGAVMSGIGEKLALLAPPLAPISALLVNPMHHLATGDVFSRLAAPPFDGASEAAAPPLCGLDDLVTYAAARPNDLQQPAIAALPLITDVLAALTDLPGAMIPRLSGSGPTCFALFGSPECAKYAAEKLADERPDWWVRPVRLGG